MEDIPAESVDMKAIGKRSRRAGRSLAMLSADLKNQALHNIADGLIKRQKEIISANKIDYANAVNNGLGAATLDRLLLDSENIEAMARDVMKVASLPDPIGETTEMKVLPNGLRVGKRIVPLGVIGAIYESRPAVTVDISVLCFKAGNAVILRGGSEAFESNSVLAMIVREGIEAAGVSADVVEFIPSTDRALVGEMLGMKDYIDLIIPRGGSELVRRVGTEATMAAITGGVGVCHIYVDEAANVDMAVSIVHNAKVQRPYVCNALDTVLIHSSIASLFLPKIADAWSNDGVEMRCDRRSMSVLGQGKYHDVQLATGADWGQEFLALKTAVKMVDSIEDAIDHIERYTSGHTEAIVTDNYESAMRFMDQVDAGVVMINASTRFNDGAQFGLGAEVGISTNKMHARGPIGLKELTSYKWTVFGSGQIRI